MVPPLTFQSILAPLAGVPLSDLFHSFAGHRKVMVLFPGRTYDPPETIDLLKSKEMKRFTSLIGLRLPLPTTVIAGKKHRAFYCYGCSPTKSQE
jgi:hypothetical protein